MPIYEYVCDECSKTFEKLVQRNEDVNCPNCKSDHLSKQFSRFGMANSSGQKYESLPVYKYESLPVYKGGCGCTPSTCGCKN